MIIARRLSAIDRIKNQLENCSSLLLQAELGIASELLGSIYIDLGRYPEAIRFLTDAIYLGNQSKDIFMELGLAYSGINRLYLAALYFTLAFTMAEEEEEEDQIAIAAYLGQIIEPLSRQINLVEARLEQLPLTNSEIATFYANIGVFYLCVRYIEKAIFYSRRALQYDPQNAIAHINLRVALEKTSSFKDLSVAIQHYKEALKIDSENPLAQMNLAMAMAEIQMKAQQN